MDNIQKQLEQIKHFIKEQNILRKEILTLEETALYLGQSKSSIYKMTSKHEIPFYSPGGKKLYFKRVELDEWVFKNKIASIEEVESEVEGYLNRNSKI
jgi:excisionase family DNA binding protein